MGKHVEREMGKHEQQKFWRSNALPKDSFQSSGGMERERMGTGSQALGDAAVPYQDRHTQPPHRGSLTGSFNDKETTISNSRPELLLKLFLVDATLPGFAPGRLSKVLGQAPEHST